MAITGAAVKWLRDNLNLFNKASEIGIYINFLIALLVASHSG